MNQPSMKGPPPGLECLVTMEPITLEEYVEYKTHPSNTWHPAKIAKETLLYLVDSQYGKYLSDFDHAANDCAAAVRRLIQEGPPEYVNEPNGLPLPAGDKHVSELWLAQENKIISARLKNSLAGVVSQRNIYDVCALCKHLFFMSACVR